VQQLKNLMVKGDPNAKEALQREVVRVLEKASMKIAGDKSSLPTKHMLRSADAKRRFAKWLVNETSILKSAIHIAADESDGLVKIVTIDDITPVFLRKLSKQVTV
jgi:hypothetical protein